MSTTAFVESFMYVPASQQERLLASARFVSENVSRIIDLEDSVKDPGDPSRTVGLKSQARGVLLDHLVQGEDDQPFYLRVNDVDSEHFEHDMEAVAGLSRKIDLSTRLQGIVLPKTTSSADVDHTISALRPHVPDLSLMPLIECHTGMSNLATIAGADSVESIGFGHHDYFFDQGVFPIPRSSLTSQLYRDTLSHMIGVIKESNQRLGRNVGYKEGIYPYLHSEQGVQDATRHLYRVGAGLRLGKTALNPLQARAIVSIGDWGQRPTVTSEDDNPGDVEAMAREILAAHNQRSNKNLGVGRRTDSDEYISVQQVLGAKQVLGIS